MNSKINDPLMKELKVSKTTQIKAWPFADCRSPRKNMGLR